MNENNQKFKNDKFIVEKEGLANFFLHSVDKNNIPSKSMVVFYNKKMEINRDITNLAIIAYNKLFNQNKLVIVDSMAASGIGSIRMLKECKNIKKIYINDINPMAIDLIKKNIQINNLKDIESLIKISKKSANLLFSELALMKQDEKPDIISIDPFGTPNLYIDSAFKAIKKKNSLICITATDTPVLFGIRKKACLRKYMSMPLHTEYCKEIGARILIYFISRIANINNLGISPLLTFYSNHFIRFFALTYKNKERIFENINKFGYIIHCSHCGHRMSFTDDILKILGKCPLCNKSQKIVSAGPLWLGNMHRTNFIEELINLNEDCNYNNKNRIKKILNLIVEENDMPITYYNLHRLSKELRLSNIPKIEKIINEIKKKKNYKASRTHFDFLSIKTSMNIKALKKLLLSL